MEHYVTLFDSLFLPQGLALHMSMARHVGTYTLWILCVDDEAHEVLAKMNLPNVCLLQLSKLETDELKLVKQARTKGEYCWTLTPFAPRFVFEANPFIQRVTYLDADVWFRKNPSPIFQEFDESGKHVLITDHAYAPEYDQSATSGQFCVQFVTFTRNGGEMVRKWWEERCLEWCYGRFEDGKFGDQKYLDDWPERFGDRVHVLQNKEWMLAPWNATRFPYANSIVWHFHGARILINSNDLKGIICGTYPLPVVTRKYVYEKYLVDLQFCVNKLTDLKVTIRSQATRSLKISLKGWLRSLWFTVWKINPDVFIEKK